jgi:hypothetical protein
MAYCSTLKMEVAYSSKMSVDSQHQRTTQRYIPEDRTLHKHHCENLKLYRCWQILLCPINLENKYSNLCFCYLKWIYCTRHSPEWYKLLWFKTVYDSSGGTLSTSWLPFFLACLIILPNTVNPVKILSSRMYEKSQLKLLFHVMNNVASSSSSSTHGLC